MMDYHIEQSPALQSSSDSTPPDSWSPDSSDELRGMPLAPPKMRDKKVLSKQLSMVTQRDIAWERRRRQILRQERKRRGIIDMEDLTDEDMTELRGSIELGFGFNEEEGQHLCYTLPALDLYFAVNRQLSPSPVSSPRSRGSTSSMGARSWSAGSEMDWKICSPGENPQQVKSKLRHWAQAVACSLMQGNIDQIPENNIDHTQDDLPMRINERVNE